MELKMSEIYEVPDLYELNKLYDEEAVMSAISLAKSMVARDYPILGGILIQMKVVLDDVQAPAGVSFDKSNVLLHINTKLWTNLIMTNTDLSALLIHETLHITQNHLARFKNSIGDKKTNIALDLAINQFSELVDTELVTKGVNMSSIRDFIKLRVNGLQTNQSAEYYLNNFADDENQNKDEKSQQQFEPNHDVWNESEPEPDEILETTAQIVQNAVEATGKSVENVQGRGLVSDELLEVIKAKGKVFTIPTLENSLKSEIGRLMKKPTKRTYFRYAPEWSPNVLRKGKKRVFAPEQKVEIFVDTSGSVNQQRLANALASIDNFNKQRSVPMTLTTKYFDTQVYEEETKLNEVLGRGGTRIQAVFDYLKAKELPLETNFIIITDGQGERKIDDFGYAGVWLLTTQPNTQIPQSHKQIRIEGE